MLSTLHCLTYLLVTLLAFAVDVCEVLEQLGEVSGSIKIIFSNRSDDCFDICLADPKAIREHIVSIIGSFLNRLFSQLIN